MPTNATQTLHALIVEDCVLDAERIASALEQAGYRLTWTRVESEADYLSALEAAPDVILSGYAMPRFSALRALALLRRSGLDIPCIIVSGTIGHNAAVETMIAGARDLILKDDLARLAPALRRELQARAARQQRQEAQEQLARRSLELNERIKELTCLYEVARLAQQSDLPLEDLFGKVASSLTGACQWPEITCARIVHGRTERQTPNYRRSEWHQEVPIVIDGAREGSVTVCYLERKSWPDNDPFLPEERSMIESVAQRLGANIHDRRLRSALAESERNFHSTFNQAAVGIVHTSLDKHYLEVNQKFCEMTGYSREELVGMKTASIAHPDDRVDDVAHRRLLLSNRIETYSGEKRYVRKDGSIFLARRTVSLARDEAGQPMYFIRVVEDVTDRKRAERDLEYKNTVLTTQLDTSLDAILLVDEHGKVVSRNQQFIDLWRIPRELAECNDDTRLLDFVLSQIRDPKRFAARVRHLYECRGDRSHEEIELLDGRTFDRHSGPVIGPDGTYYGRVWYFRDATERKQAIRQLRESEWRFRAIFDHAGVGISMRHAHDRTLPWLQVNDRFCAMLGYSRKELLQLSTADVTHPEEQGAAVEDNGRLLAGEITSYTREKRMMCKDGTFIWVILTVSTLPGSDGTPEYIMATYQDISDRVRVQEALMESDEKFRQLSDNIPQVFWITDADQKSVIYASPAYETVTGRRLVDLEGNPRDWLEAVHCEDRERVRHARRHKAPAGEYDIEYRIVHADGTVRWVHDRAFPVKDATGAVRRIAGITDDITERRNAEERLLQLAHYDALTSLPNRVLFRDRLAQALAQAGRNDWIAGVMFIDLDRFKLVNDSLGHTAGDMLLQQVSVRISECLRVGDTVGRLGGDEFSVILPRIAAVQDARFVAQKILDALAEPFMIDGNEIFVSASIGITLYPSDSVDIDTLIKNADAAMFSAKEAGRGIYHFFTQEMNERALERMRIESRLRRALERGEFVLHYQPKVTVADDRISGVEALLRWQVPGDGLISPDSFIPVLEETGLIVPVGEWVVRSACAQIAAWRSAGVKPVPIAINISARQLQQPGFSAMVAAMLAEHGIEPKWLEIEITESSIMFHPDDASAVLGGLKALGIRISVDDFGTGYSSLARLKRFPLDALKIDRSFVRDLATDPDDAAITRSVITLAHSLDLGVVAEGVETPEQLAYLLENGCDEAQGYLFSRPLPAAECTALLQDRRKPPSDGDGTQHLLRYAPPARRGRVPNRALQEAAAAADAERGQLSNLAYV